MAPHTVIVDTLSALREVTRNVLQSEFAQISSQIGNSGQPSLARMGLLFTLLGTLLFFVIEKRKGIAGAMLLTVALGFTGVLYILDWQQRDITERLSDRDGEIVHELLNLNSYPIEVLQSDSLLFGKVPRHSMSQKTQTFIPGFYDALPYVFVGIVLNLVALYLARGRAERKRFIPPKNLIDFR